MNGLFTDSQRTAVAGQGGKAGEEGGETPTKERIKTGARRSHLSGRPRTQIKVLGGMGVQGEGRPFSKRGPFPCQKNSLTLFQQTHDAPEEGAAGVGRTPVVFLAGFGQQFFQLRASRGFGIGPGEGR